MEQKQEKPTFWTPLSTLGFSPTSLGDRFIKDKVGDESGQYQGPSLPQGPLIPQDQWLPVLQSPCG